MLHYRRVRFVLKCATCVKILQSSQDITQLRYHRHLFLAAVANCELIVASTSLLNCLVKKHFHSRQLGTVNSTEIESSLKGWSVWFSRGDDARVPNSLQSEPSLLAPQKPHPTASHLSSQAIVSRTPISSRNKKKKPSYSPGGRVRAITK